MSGNVDGCCGSNSITSLRVTTTFRPATETMIQFLRDSTTKRTETNIRTNRSQNGNRSEVH